MKTQQAQLPASYRAWVSTGSEQPLDLVLKQQALPDLADDEVLIKNYAIGLNPVDWKVLSSQQGQVVGVDGAGVVVAVGTQVDVALLGCRVAYHQNLQAQGSFAEYTPVKAYALLKLPDELSWSQAAAIPCPALTAWQAIGKIPVQTDAEILIAGAGGSVGHFLVQFAAQRGFQVTASCHPRHWQRLHGLGATRCIADPVQADQSLHLSKKFYAVLDMVGSQHAEALSDAVLANGHLLCIQGRVATWICSPFGRAISLHEVALGALHQHGTLAQWQALTQVGEQIFMAIATGELQAEVPLLHARFAELPQQLQALKHRNFSGKQVIQMDDKQNFSELRGQNDSIIYALST